MNCIGRSKGYRACCFFGQTIAVRNVRKHGTGVSGKDCEITRYSEDSQYVVSGPEHRSRRRPTSVAASGSSLPAALARRASTAGVRRGGASTARPTRSPTRPGAVLVGDTLALPLPVPARAPLLARLGVLACEAVFPSPAVHRELAAPCVPPCSFFLLVTWPAWRTVQTKVVSIYFW